MAVSKLWNWRVQGFGYQFSMYSFREEGTDTAEAQIGDSRRKRGAARCSQRWLRIGDLVNRLQLV
jgi:hypothetical protein